MEKLTVSLNTTWRFITIYVLSLSDWKLQNVYTSCIFNIKKHSTISHLQTNKTGMETCLGNLRKKLFKNFFSDFSLWKTFFFFDWHSERSSFQINQTGSVRKSETYKMEVLLSTSKDFAGRNIEWCLVSTITKDALSH